MNEYQKAMAAVRGILGSYAAIGRACGNLSGEAVRKWFVAGHPPRTEYTGETDYARAISEAVEGVVTEHSLRPARNYARRAA